VVERAASAALKEKINSMSGDVLGTIDTALEKDALMTELSNASFRIGELSEALETERGRVQDLEKETERGGVQDLEKELAVLDEASILKEDLLHGEFKILKEDLLHEEIKILKEELFDVRQYSVRQERAKEDARENFKALKELTVTLTVTPNPNRNPNPNPNLEGEV